MNGSIGNRGVFLTEVIVSLFLFTTVLLLAYPILRQTFRERLILQQRIEAVGVLKYELTRWKTGNQTFSPPDVSTVFILDWQKKTNREALLCITWTESGRRERLCGESRK